MRTNTDLIFTSEKYIFYLKKYDGGEGGGGGLVNVYESYTFTTDIHLPNYVRLFVTKRPVINWEHFAQFSILRKEGKHWKESLMQTSRTTFLLYTAVTPPIATTIFYVIAIVWWRHETKGLVALPNVTSVTVKQPSTLLNICTLKSNSKHFKSLRTAPKHAKWYIFFQTKIYSL